MIGVLLLDQTIFLKDLFHPTQKKKKEKKEGQKKTERGKENGYEYSKKSSRLKLTYLNGNENFSGSFIPKYYLFHVLTKVTGLKWRFITSWSLSHLPKVAEIATEFRL